MTPWHPKVSKTGSRQEEYVYTTLATFAVEESLRKGMPVAVDLAPVREKV